ncbi:MAG: exonuclease [Clostridia bacterium]|nr:exonuclease [Clostridia bacterium]MDH7572697.1 exonuclease [Clostridia bacterium]
MPVRLTFYDGVGCIGGNKILLEDGPAALFLDFGTSFSAEAKFFDEFLGPRNTFGFFDLLALGILPPLEGLYRPDLEYPGVWDTCVDHPWRRRLDLQGIVLTHAHLDHCGYLSYLRADLPVFASLTTALILKALQDTGSAARLQEVSYTAPRELREGLLRPADPRRTAYCRRPYRVFGPDELSEAAARFWDQTFGSRRLAGPDLTGCGTGTKLGELELRVWPVDHSVPGAVAVGVRTSAGWVVYTGDLRLHGRRADLTRRFLQEAAELEPAFLICEGTHPEVERPVSEEEVKENSLAVVREARGLVVADFGPRNVERLLSFLEIARATGRRLVLTAKDFYLLEALTAAGEPGVPDPETEPGICLYAKPKAVLAGWEKHVLERFSRLAPDRVLGAREVRAGAGELILCFSYYDFHAFLDISPGGGTYLYSSSEAFDEEMLLDHERVRNWIRHFGFELYGTLGREREKSGFHASGHVHGPGLEEMVETLRPRLLVPVHTQSPDFFRRFEGVCRVVYPQKGQEIAL